MEDSEAEKQRIRSYREQPQTDDEFAFADYRCEETPRDVEWGD